MLLEDPVNNKTAKESSGTLKKSRCITFQETLVKKWEVENYLQTNLFFKVL